MHAASTWHSRTSTAPTACPPTSSQRWVAPHVRALPRASTHAQAAAAAAASAASGRAGWRAATRALCWRGRGRWTSDERRCRWGAKGCQGGALRGGWVAGGARRSLHRPCIGTALPVAALGQLSMRVHTVVTVSEPAFFDPHPCAGVQGRRRALPDLHRRGGTRHRHPGTRAGGSSGVRCGAGRLCCNADGRAASQPAAACASPRSF